MPGEFDIINKYFRFSGQDKSVLMGVGDDAAVLALSHSLPGEKNSGGRLVVATDTLLEGVHFPAGMPAEHVASRSLLVNVSDFAAMGVRPRWFTIALALPDANEDWLARFSSRMGALCEELTLSLVGGDTVKGPLSISLTLMGEADGQVLSRAAAKPGDELWVTNSLGRGGAALKLLDSEKQSGASPGNISAVEKEQLLQHFYAPDCLLDLGVGLSGVAHAAIDISDGLLADAGHIASQSGVAIDIEWDALPVNTIAKKLGNPDEVRRWVLTHGDDYQLLFTASAGKRPEVEALAREADVACTCIGKVREGGGVKLHGIKSPLEEAAGFQHFS